MPDRDICAPKVRRLKHSEEDGLGLGITKSDRTISTRSYGTITVENTDGPAFPKGSNQTVWLLSIRKYFVFSTVNVVVVIEEGLRLTE